MDWMKSLVLLILIILTTCSGCMSMEEPGPPNRLYIDDLELLSSNYALIKIQDGGTYRERTENTFCKIIDLNTGLIGHTIKCKQYSNKMEIGWANHHPDYDSTSTIIHSLFDNCDGTATVNATRNNENIQIELVHYSTYYKYCYNKIPFAYFTINTHNERHITTTFILTDNSTLIVIKFIGYNDNNRYSLHKGHIADEINHLRMSKNTPLESYCSIDLQECLFYSIPGNLGLVYENVNLIQIPSLSACNLNKYRISKSQTDDDYPDEYIITLTQINSIACDSLASIDFSGQRLITSERYGLVLFVYDLKENSKNVSFTPNLTKANEKGEINSFRSCLTGNQFGLFLGFILFIIIRPRSV